MANRADLYDLSDYATHLKSLDKEGKYFRFCGTVSDYVIDQCILNILYNPHKHQLWHSGCRHAWAQVSTLGGNECELAISVDEAYRNRKLGSKLFSDVIAECVYLRFDKVHISYHPDNTKIKHLARKHNCILKSDSGTLQLKPPDMLDLSAGFTRDQLEVFEKLRSVFLNQKIYT